MLISDQVNAGLGKPPIPFTTNACESVSAVLKKKCDYKCYELPVFLDKLKEYIEEQEKKVERAVVNQGKYKFADQFKMLQKTEEQWANMSLVQKANHLRQSTLLAKQNAVCPAPGDSKLDCMVESNPEPHHLHLILAKKSDQYDCDSACANWKSLCICSHSVPRDEQQVLMNLQ